MSDETLIISFQVLLTWAYMTHLYNFTLGPLSTFHRVFFTLQWSNLSSRTSSSSIRKVFSKLLLCWCHLLYSNTLHVICPPSGSCVPSRGLLNPTRGEPTAKTWRGRRSHDINALVLDQVLNPRLTSMSQRTALDAAQKHQQSRHEEFDYRSSLFWPLSGPPFRPLPLTFLMRARSCTSSSSL